MTTVPEFLRWDLVVGEPASLMLRSGRLITGVLDEVDLTAYVVRIGGWTVRVDEVAGARSGRDQGDDHDVLRPDLTGEAPDQSGLQPATVGVG